MLPVRSSPAPPVFDDPIISTAGNASGYLCNYKLDSARNEQYSAMGEIDKENYAAKKKE